MAATSIPPLTLELLGRIQDAIRASACRGREHERLGPFLATFDREDANPYLNYAVPDAGASPSAEDVEGLVAAYRRRQRAPRLEYVPALAPSVEPALRAAGFEVESRTPLLTCTAATDVREAIPAGVELLAPVSEDDYRAVASVQWEAYEGSGAVPQRVVDSLRRTAGAGGAVVLVRDVATGDAAGAGLCTVPEDGLTELTSVAVRAPFRRRGIAAALTAWLAARGFERGATGVFLMAAGAAEERIYRRAGFTPCSEVLHTSRP